MLGGAYSNQYKNLERQQLDTIKTFAENEKTDKIARAKKLSLETNKRRRALALKRKNDAEREEKRRQQILAKRREKQKEATERFQRAHMPPRPSSGTSNASSRWSPRRTTQLEDALQIVRGSPATTRVSSARTHDRESPTRTSLYRQNSDPLSKPYFNKYAHPTINQSRSDIDKREALHNKSLHNLNASRSLFEKQLETHQQLLLEQQQNALREFNKQVLKEVEFDKNVTNGEPNENFERTESLSSVDSLEETVSNDTLRESCDLDAFDNKPHNIKTDVRINGNICDKNRYVNHTAGSQYTLSPKTPVNIDSYNTQLQAVSRTEEKQQFYQQRQLEIQQQLQEQKQQQYLQQQQQQQEDLQQRLEQQQKQQKLLQEEFHRQNEQLQEKQEKQLEKIQTNQQSNLSSNNAQYTRTESEKENQRPKVQLKAWATPSPQPPTPVSANVSKTNSMVTNASPYTGRSTNTNVTTVTGYDASVIRDNSYINSKPVSVTVSTIQDELTPGTVTSQARTQSIVNTTPHSNSELLHSRAYQSQGSFLETVTKDLGHQSEVTAASEQSTHVSGVTSYTNNGNNLSSNENLQKVTPQASLKNVPNNMNSPKTNPIVTKPPLNSAFYLNSYSSAYSMRQNLQQKQQQQSKTVLKEHSSAGPVTTVDASRLSIKPTNGSQHATENQHSIFQINTYNGDEGQDTADTDSVSTIGYEEKEPEPKAEVKGILKRGVGAKGILKKSGSTGSLQRYEIRDSLEITRVHLQTSAEEKEQRRLRELERKQAQDVVITKKNVRFADLTYDEPVGNGGQQGDDNKLFVKRNFGEGQNGSTGNPRPVSAVSIKSTPSRVDHKPPRASSATVRASTIPRAKTQVVRPQAAAHIIHSPPSTVNGGNNMDKRVTIVNNNFMEKVPSVSRGNQVVHTASPSMVYTVSSRTDPQKVNYAVSSIVMPKSNSAPFIYPGYSKDALQPSSSSTMPAHNGTGTKYDSAVYDENGLRIDRTPTDEEINFLWDKVRTCLSRNSSNGEKVQTPVSTIAESHRQAAPVANTYIDGNALGQFNSMNRVAAPNYGNNPALHRQNSLDNATGSYAKRYGLLQQRKQQPNPNSLKSRQQQPQVQGHPGYTVYHAPVQSYNEPVQTVQVNGDVSESMAEFLTAEQLSEQSVSESKIHQAMDEAHAKQQAYIASKPPAPKARSALSMEEQRLLESLDRLNDRLKVKEQTAQPSPHQAQSSVQQQQTPQQVLHTEETEGKKQTSVSGFKGHQPLHSQRRVIESANPRSRLRITSATLKKHLNRTQ